MINKKLKGLTVDQKNEIKETFSIFDKEEKDEMKINDLKIAMMALGLKPSTDEIERIIKQIKADNSGMSDSLSYQQFYDIVAYKVVNKDSNKEAKKLYFIMQNKNKSNMIGSKILNNIAKRFDVEINDSELKDLVKAADFDEDGEISENDFIRVLKRTNFY